MEANGASCTTYIDAAAADPVHCANEATTAAAPVLASTIIAPDAPAPAPAAPAEKPAVTPITAAEASTPAAPAPAPPPGPAGSCIGAEAVVHVGRWYLDVNWGYYPCS